MRIVSLSVGLPREGVLWIGRRRRRNDRGRLDISSPNVASVDQTEARKSMADDPVINRRG